MTKNLKGRVEELFKEVAKRYDSEIETMGVVSDHVHIFVSAPPKYFKSKIVGVLKSISLKVVFEEFPRLEKHFFGRGSFGVIGFFM